MKIPRMAIILVHPDSWAEFVALVKTTDGEDTRDLATHVDRMLGGVPVMLSRYIEKGPPRVIRDPRIKDGNLMRFAPFDTEGWSNLRTPEAEPLRMVPRDRGDE